jgi:RNA polymerase sigma-70 factor (ECF subfamily)
MRSINWHKEDTVKSISSNPKVIFKVKLTEEKLWMEFKGGDETAYACIYRGYAPLLYSYGLKLVNNKDLVKDCIQDLFVEMWDSKKKLGDVKTIKPYLFKAIRRKVINEAVRSRRNVLTDELDDYSKISLPKEYSLIEKQAFDLQRRKLKIGLDNLTEKQREVIYLKFFAKLSYDDISEVLSITKKGTYKLMGRSITFLRKHMDQKD